MQRTVPEHLNHARLPIKGSEITQRDIPDRSPQAACHRAAHAWSLILSAARLARNAAWSLEHPLALRAGPDGRVAPVDPAHRSHADLLWQPHAGWRPGDHLVDAEALALFDLYLPFCRAHPGTPEIIGHLGQSIDGYIATASGDARFVTGEANIRHLHRMRALSDAVLVGDRNRRGGRSPPDHPTGPRTERRAGGFGSATASDLRAASVQRRPSRNLALLRSRTHPAG
ncbi:hypothetical protein THIOKS11020034 [Thiocapsa sp. KS1]|nr:hypothetical protein THIOKS11020034 [Thiocapsa sp. KS1]